MTKPAEGGGELLIHLDVAGLAALMKAVQEAMTQGRGQLALSDGSVTVMGPGCSLEQFGRVTVTFEDPADPPDDNWRSGRPDRQPRHRVLALRD
ncbi:MAG TPA: hypothetical protein VF535_00695 [Allosphingosinicella sp.]